MNIRYILVGLFVGSVMANGRELWSPDHRARIEAGESIDLFDEGTQTMMTIIGNTIGAKRVEVAWSPDSDKVAIVENFDRGSVIYAAWFDGMNWHKTLQSDTDSIIGTLQRQLGARVMREERVFAGWMDKDALRVKWRLGFNDGRSIECVYRLEFVNAARHVDRGGYEEGKIVGRDMETL